MALVGGVAWGDPLRVVTFDQHHYILRVNESLVSSISRYFAWRTSLILTKLTEVVEVCWGHIPANLAIEHNWTDKNHRDLKMLRFSPQGCRILTLVAYIWLYPLWSSSVAWWQSMKRLNLLATIPISWDLWYIYIYINILIYIYIMGLNGI